MEAAQATSTAGTRGDPEPGWIRSLRRLTPPFGARTPRRLAALALTLVPLSFSLAPVWAGSESAPVGLTGATVAGALLAAGAVLGGAFLGWLVDRADGSRRTDFTIYRAVLVAAVATATLTLGISAACGTTVGAAAGEMGSRFGAAALGGLVGGSLALWVAPLLALPAAALAGLLLARTPGGRDNALIALVASTALFACVGAASPLAPVRAWALGIGGLGALVLAGVVLGSARRLFWAMRLVRSPHRFWRLETLEEPASAGPALPRLANSADVVLLLRDPSAGGPFRAAEAFRPVAVLPRSAAGWVLTTLARATVAAALAAGLVALTGGALLG